MGECWAGGTATFMVLGDTCTRGCRFCCGEDVGRRGTPVDREAEPAKVAEAVSRHGAAPTSSSPWSTGTTCEDGGARPRRGDRSEAIKQRRTRHPGRGPDRRLPRRPGPDRHRAGGASRRGHPDVFAHNIETVAAPDDVGCATRSCDYHQTLRGPANAAKEIRTRRRHEVVDHGRPRRGRTGSRPGDGRPARAHDVDVVTLGQYLRPTMLQKHLPVKEHVTPAPLQGVRTTGRSAQGLPLRGLRPPGAVLLQGRRVLHRRHAAPPRGSASRNSASRNSACRNSASRGKRGGIVMTTEVLTIIEKDGKVAKGNDPNLSDDELRTLYADHGAPRAIMDERGTGVAAPGSHRLLPPWRLGQEASHIGSAYAATRQRLVVPRPIASPASRCCAALPLERDRPRVVRPQRRPLEGPPDASALLASARINFVSRSVRRSARRSPTRPAPPWPPKIRKRRHGLHDVLRRRGHEFERLPLPA